MNIIDKLGSYTIRFFSMFGRVNKKKNVNLFLYKRNLTLIQFCDRIFIKLDKTGETFIQEILSSEFEKYTIINKNAIDKFLNDKNKPTNKFIVQVWFNDLFRFEIINDEHWKHLQFAVDFANKYDLPISLDSTFVHFIENIEKFTGEN